MGIISNFVNSWMFIPALVVGTAVASIVFFKSFVSAENKGIEEEALEEVIRGEVRDKVELFGSEVKKKVSYGLSPIGKVHKAWAFTEWRPLKDKEKFKEGSDNFVKTEDGRELKKVADKFYFKIRPTGLLASIMAWVVDDILNFENFTKWVVVPHEFVQDGEVITLDDSWNMRKMAGVWLSDNEKGAKFVKEETYYELFERVMESTKETIRAINHLNINFTQDIQKLEKEEELLQKRYGSKAAGMVNEG